MFEDCSFIITSDEYTRIRLLEADLVEFSVNREKDKETFYFVNEPKKTVHFEDNSKMKMKFTNILSF